ncbi:MAG: hypothetical protein MUE78_05045 [Ilumatobacteraceae bacterium]|nr:hypothetical protein [Ilumatobacteraceae bacterium]
MGGRLVDAVIVDVRSRRGHAPDDGEPNLLDDLEDMLRRESWDLTLEVAPPHGAPLRFTTVYRAPRRPLAFGRPRWRPVAGLVVPVRLFDDGREPEPDWDEFLRRGGKDQATAAAAAQDADIAATAMGDMLAEKPKVAARQREMMLTLGPAMAAEVRQGVRPAHEFARQVESLVRGGALSRAEGDELLQAAGLA